MTSPTARHPAITTRNLPAMLIKSTLAGGVILFLWQFISCGLLPLRRSVLHAFRDEGAVAAALTSNAPVSGMYILPLANMSGASEQAKAATEKRAAEGPIVFAAIRLGGVRPFSFGLTVQFVTQLV